MLNSHLELKKELHAKMNELKKVEGELKTKSPAAKQSKFHF